MITRPNGTKYKMYFLWENIKNPKYNYNAYGILPTIMSKDIINTKNKALKYILSFYDNSIIFLLNYIDELRNFKNIHWKNR